MAITTDEGEGDVTFFYGFVRKVDFRVGGALIWTDDESYIIASDKDRGLSYLRLGKKQLVVISHGRIKAIFFRPRIALFQLFGAGGKPSHRGLAKLRPRYLAEESEKEKPPAKIPPRNRFSELYD